VIATLQERAKRSPALVKAYGQYHFLKDFLLVAARDPEKRRLFLRIKPYTMSSMRRLDNVYQLAAAVERERLPGVFVECGVWNGGCGAIMAYMAKRANSGRVTWFFDSFEGLPEPTDRDGTNARLYANNRSSGELRPIEQCVGSQELVEEVLFEKLDIDPESVRIRKGWFQDTIPASASDIGPIAILRLDGDWYESTKLCLENLFDNVVPGGYVIIDDYGFWEGCARAVDEFIAQRGLNLVLQPIDYAGRFFRK
jgi:O-methyltransferase